MTETLHIICLDAPSPPDYGGAIDMFYKLKALAAAGKKIILHYFDYKAGRHAEDLEAGCLEIHRYERESFFSGLFSNKPYIVRSRIHEALVKRLNQDRHPILSEGIHCSGVLPYLNDPRRLLIRMHNEEVAYYTHLAASTRSLYQKLYFRREAAQLRSYYQHLPKNIPLVCLSSCDEQVLRKDFGFVQTAVVPCFIPWQKINSKPGRGDYCLYHGNLSVPENEAAVYWLIEKVFAGLQLPLVIAGSSVPERLWKRVKTLPDVRIIADPPARELSALIRDAQLHVLPSMNNTGVKLKLLHALFEGRFVISNSNGAKGGEVDGLVRLADSPEAFRLAVQELYDSYFDEAQIKNRQRLLTVYNNEWNAQKLSALW